MSTIHQCDRCGRQSSDPKVEGWVTHFVVASDALGLSWNDIGEDKVAVQYELCHSCREGYEDWMKAPLADE